ncbi:MAG TPA: hypothetical protein VL463_13745 [Kofleriaceae bacterium]|nr:hypothetical protein [Kofleriaceae bacterium]
MRVKVPTSAGNKAIKTGELPKVIGNFLETHKPEAAYFTAEAGERTAFFVVDVKEASQMPPMFEPLFMELDAHIDIIPVMSAGDLQAGLAALK